MEKRGLDNTRLGNQAVQKLMETEIVTKAVLANEKDEILIVRRSKTAPRRPLQWDLPGGGVESGDENFAKAVSREVLEETGIAVDHRDLRLVHTHTEIIKGVNVIWLHFAASVAKPEVKLSFEHSEYQWLPLEKAIKEFEYPLQRDLLQHLHDNKII